MHGHEHAAPTDGAVLAAGQAAFAGCGGVRTGTAEIFKGNGAEEEEILQQRRPRSLGGGDLEIDFQILFLGFGT
jgi:hypothetical protein